MPLEISTYISGLVSTNPPDTDPEGQGAAHIRLLKGAITNTFPNLSGAVTATQGSLNAAGALQPSGPGLLVVPREDTLTTTTGGAISLSADGAGNPALTIRNTGGKLVISDGGSNSLTYDRTTKQVLVGTTPISFIGEIRMWSGSIGTIPSGWALCNGSNGTPNLTDRFIVGAGGTYAVGATGGSSTTTLVAANLPSHSHSITDPGHTHAHVDPGHTHVIYDPGHVHTTIKSASVMAGANAIGVNDAVNGDQPTKSATTGIANYTAFTGMTNSVNTTGITTTNAFGSGTAFTTLPPYYALCFIMRIA